MFILAFVSISAYAQSLTVTGKVIDSEGYEVIGGSVTIKGAAGIGTVTDVNGNYSLKVNDASKDVLVFSYVGMTSQEVKVNGKNVINVTLKADAVLLDEVVAIGYATVKRKDLTGSVASVGNQEIAKVPVSDVTQALSGRMAGVQVQQTEGAPGSSVSIRIRGGISITQSNEPLYVIDGFPSEDGMSTLDPAEIETIDVLKDASATAIYGARGANGVVVITTKNGSKSGGKATVTFDSYVGFKKIAKKLDVREGAIVVPMKAVTIEKVGAYIYTMRKDDTVEKRFIELGPEVGNNVVVERGLAVGETIVVEGFHKLTPGMKVRASRLDNAKGE